LTARDRATAIAAIDRQLRHQPLAETRNRKRLRPNPVAPWELRVGQLRVFYEVIGGESGVIRILAMGRKQRIMLKVAGKETAVVTEGNRAVAAIVPLKNVVRETLVLSQHPEFLELIARSRADFAAGRTISLDEMSRRVLPKRSPNKRIQPTARRARRR
jgi:PHD/YefM family antitoxin component YafN of YafNO toxin-antitoxin module